MPSPEGFKVPDADEQAQACNRRGITLALAVDQQQRIRRALLQMHVAELGFHSAIMISPGYLFAVECESEEAGSLNSQIVFSSLLRRQRRIPADGKRLHSGNFAGQRRGSEIDNRLNARGERCRLVLLVRCRHAQLRVTCPDARFAIRG